MTKITKQFLKQLIKEQLEECGCDMEQGMQPQDVKSTPIDPDGYEGAMAKSNLYNMIKNAQNMHDMIMDEENLEPWVEEKIAVAAQMINSVADHIAYQKISGKR